MKKLWQKEEHTNRVIDSFTVGKDRELDLRLAPFDVKGSLAHIKMLNKISLLSDEEYALLSKELQSILDEILRGDFVIEPDVEDIHSQIEILLTRRIGEAGKKIHSGRSRNDQVLTDIKLYLRWECQNIARAVKELFDTLQMQSNRYKEVLLPGYTHTQIAMPSSFGLWFGAYAESLIDDIYSLRAAYSIINQNPLGSAAGYGSSFPLDRAMTTEELSFASLNVNAVSAQLSRGKSEKAFAFAIASIASTLNKFASDAILYMSGNFSFISLPASLTTGSSIMPHKRNPDVWEIIRAKSNMIQSLPNEISLITTNLIHGYHRDFQLLKEVLFPAIDSIKELIEVSSYMIKEIIVNGDILNDKLYDHLFTVEEVNRLVLDGLPFRDAYLLVSDQVKRGEFEGSKKITHTHIGSMGNLSNELIKEKMDQALSLFGELI